MTHLNRFGGVAATVVAQAVAMAQRPASPTTRPARELTLDLDRAVRVEWPEVTADLTPVVLKAADGRAGWAVRLPGNRPIATPAYADGMLFVGGGYGSHEFYAIDARSGNVVWQVRTVDDGPSAAVVEDGYVAFNTESCTIIVLEAKTGKLVWQEWLGDPLMSQPAIADGRLYMAYPGGNPRGVQAGDGAPIKPPAANHPQAAGGRGGHRLLCSDLKTGAHLWEREITGDVLSAPVVQGKQVLLTCFDGTSFCLSAEDGSVVWKKKDGGTSAPLAADGQIITTRKREESGRVSEGIVRLDAGGESKDGHLLAAGNAEYFRPGREGAVALSAAAQKQQDAAVGFATAPAAAGLAAAQSHVNIGTVAGGWAYQGSRAAYARGRILNAQADRLNCVGASDGAAAWRAKAVGKGIDGGRQVFSPPALGKENLYACTAAGHVLSVRQRDGEPVWTYALGRPVAFQPALAEGNVYFGTADGMLVCLKTGDADADGWYAWGGNARHNKDR